MAAYKTNVLIWRMFMSSSMKAAIHLGPNYLTNVEIYKNTNFEEDWKFIQYYSEVDNGTFWRNSECKMAGKFISSLDEMSIISWSSDQMGKSKSVRLCKFRSMSWTDEWQQRSDRRWEGQVEELKMYPSYQEAVGIDGEPIELEWNIFPGFSSLWICQRIQEDLKRKKIKPEEFMDEIIFISMFNDIDWSEREWWNLHLEHRKSQGLLDEILARTLDVSGSWVGKEVVWWIFLPPKGEWDPTAFEMVQRFKKSGHAVFKSTSALSRGILKRKKGFETIHFNGDSSNTELLFQNNSFCKSAQYLRSSGELVSSIRFDRGREGTR